MLQYLNSNKGYKIYDPTTQEETSDISKELVKKEFEAVFACGGDGTLNLVSSNLIHTETALGIIPFGSGNGYARHHKIPLKWQEALHIVEEHQESLRDTGQVNGKHFLNIAGIGYSAKISHAFNKGNKRGLSSYVNTVLKNLLLETFEVKVTNEDASWKGETWMIDFCNGSQWGNNIKIEPGARDDDGSLRAVIFKKISTIKIPKIGFQILSNQTDLSSDIFKITGADFTVEFKGTRPLHVDGEAAGFAEDKLVVKVVPKCLKLWKA